MFFCIMISAIRYGQINLDLMNPFISGYNEKKLISNLMVTYMYSLFVGMLFGIAIRTGSPLSLNIAEPVWKQVAGMPLSLSDLAEIDKDWLPGSILQFFCFVFTCMIKILS